MKKAFTLVEILVSLSILMIGIVVIFNLFPLGWQSFSYARRLSAVSLLAEKKMGELKLQSEIKDESGEEQGLNWKITSQIVKLPENIEITQVQLDIDFDFQGRKMNERFITYMSKDEK